MKKNAKRTTQELLSGNAEECARPPTPLSRGDARSPIRLRRRNADGLARDAHTRTPDRSERPGQRAVRNDRHPVFYTQHLGFSVSFVSAGLVAATLLAIGGDLISGRFSDASSPKPVLLAGLVLSAIATALLLVVWDQVSFVVAL